MTHKYFIVEKIVVENLVEEISKICHFLPMIRFFFCLIFCDFNLLIKMLYKVKQLWRCDLLSVIFFKNHSNHSPCFPAEVLLDKSNLRTSFDLGSRCVLREETEGLNAGNILLFNENTLSKWKFLLTIRKSEELKYSSIVLPESVDIDRGYHLVCYIRFIALSQQQPEKIGERWGSDSQNKTVLTRSGITSPKSHSNSGIFPKICLFCSSARKKIKGKGQKLINVENSEF